MRMRPLPLADTDGLCQFDDPDRWFQHGPRAAVAKRICANCPVRRACAQAALDLRVTDGVWAGVRLPGARFPEDLEKKRASLRRVIDGMTAEPEAHRRRALAIRAALHQQYHLAPARAGV
jgi:WhiB family transcriptional regulator, redox-sensing transcriptional regulator